MSNLRKINAFKCRMWSMHDRLGDDINMDSCRSLLESMENHGQKHPVLGRLVVGDPDYDVELIYGARRLFIAQQLGTELLVEIREIDDRQALIEMDIENRVRLDISPYERGLSYRRWLKTGHFGSQAEIAKCLGVSEAQVSRLLRYSELPAAVIGAFPSARDIREEWAVALAKCCRDTELRNGLLSRARSCANAERELSPQNVYDVLINDGSRKLVAAKARDEVVKGRAGDPMLRVAFRAKTVHLIVARDNLTTPALEDLKRLIVDYLSEKAPPAPQKQPSYSKVASDRTRSALRIRAMDSPSAESHP